MSYWTLIKFGIPFLIGALLFGGIAWKWRGATIEKLNNQIGTLEAACVKNEKTITDLKTELKKTSETCSARIKGKDNTIKKLREIDDLKPGVQTNEKAVDPNDPILNALGGMWRKDSNKD